MSEQKATEVLTGENVEFEISNQPLCVVEYQVRATQDLVKKARKKAIHDVAKEVSVPGFRKGRAPDELILRRYPDVVDQKWQKAIADDAFQAVQNVARIPLLNTRIPITFDMKKHDENGAEMKFTFEREPIVPEIDVSKIELKDLPVEEITEETLDEAIRQVSFFFAEWTTALDRAAKAGDYVLLNINTLEGDKEHPAFNETRFEMSEKSMSKWMLDLVTGMKTGEKKDGVSEPDDDATEDEKKAFQPKNVRVELVKIEEAKLPALDDAFAAKVGCKTYSEVRENIRNLLNAKSEENRQKALRDLLSEQLLKHFPFDLPKSLLEEEVKVRIDNSLQNPRFKKEWEEKTDEQKKEHEEMIRKQGENAIRLFYICRKVATDANIELSTDEIQPSQATFLELLLGLRSPHEQQPTPEQQSIEMTKLMLKKADQIEKKGESKKG